VSDESKAYLTEIQMHHKNIGSLDTRLAEAKAQVKAINKQIIAESAMLANIVRESLEGLPLFDRNSPQSHRDINEAVASLPEEPVIKAGVET